MDMYLNNNNNNESNNMMSPTNMMNTLSLQNEDVSFSNNLIETMNNSSNSIDSNNNNINIQKLSLVDITVSEILETYKYDTDLLKHILAAKTEEDKRRSAEEIRRAEEARLQSKYIDLQLDPTLMSPILDNASLGLPSNDWLSQVSNNNLLSPSYVHNTPPSPSQVQPLSPYTLFDLPLADLNLSAPPSPEPYNPPSLLVEKISLYDDPPTPVLASDSSQTLSDQPTKQELEKEYLVHQFPFSPPPIPATPKERASIKRTFSRTRSTRKPSVRVLTKKNRYLQQSTVVQSVPDPEQKENQPNQKVDLQEEFNLKEFNTEEFNAEEFNPDEFNPDDFNPDDFNSNDFNPEHFNPDDFNPEGFSPESHQEDFYCQETKVLQEQEVNLKSVVEKPMYDIKKEETKPIVKKTTKKEETVEKPVKKEESKPLNHDTVMEALRAKLKRSSQQLKEQKNMKEEITSMSPTGMLLLDLKNPKKVYPIRTKATTPRVSVVKKPSSFISAHKPKET